LVTGNTDNLKSSVFKVASVLASMHEDTLDRWSISENSISLHKHMCDNMVEQYQMPRKLDWNLFNRIYDIRPQNYEQLISIAGVGPATVRALSLIGELIYGTRASWQDPVRYTFAHGGKVGVPYPVARRVYDESIRYLSSAIEGAEIQREVRVHALKRLAEQTARMFNTHNKQR